MSRQLPSVTTKSSSKVLLCAAAIAALGAGACSDETDAGSSDSEELQQVSSGPDSNAPFVASITANGTGCPSRSWTAKLADDGQSFRILFVDFENEVNRYRSISVKDCQLSIKVKSPADQQYAVEAFNYTGYARLRDGASAKVLTSAYFQGNPAEAAKSSIEINGEYDKSYEFGTEIPPGEAVWSECGKERDLNVRTTVRLQGADRASSYISLAEIEGLKLSVRQCSAEAPDSSVPPPVDGGIDAGPEPEIDGGTDAEVPEEDAGPATGPTISSVTANGTGCPADSWTATIAPNQKSFKVAFDAFEATTSETQALAVKDCQLAVKVTPEAGQRYALKTFGVQTTTTLGAGANARFLGNYYFQGDPSVAAKPEATQTGPFDGDYTFTGSVADADLVWSTCGTERDLNLRTTVRLQNGTPATANSVKVRETGTVELVTSPCP